MAAKLGRVILRCPRTDLDYSPELNTDEDSFRGPEALMRAHCPHCSAEHEWRPSEARFVSIDPINGFPLL